MMTNEYDFIGDVKKNASNRVNRGGSWNNNAKNCRVANCNRNNLSNRNNKVGVRFFSTFVK